MREIKFRAWDKNDKVMVYVLEMKFLFESEKGIWSKGYTNDRIDHEIFPENLELMQYTGLKDKNKKEIYEGDVVGGWVCDYDGPFEVFFDAGVFSLKATIEDDGYYPCLYEGNPESGLEIIGNIYETEHLLNKE